MRIHASSTSYIWYLPGVPMTRRSTFVIAFLVIAMQENLEGPNRNTRRREKLRSWARYLASIDKRDAEIYRKEREKAAAKPVPAAQVKTYSTNL